jgi:hypothetical protein
VARPRRIKPGDECEGCFGCGHVCTACGFPVNACIDLEDCLELDTEKIETCPQCAGTGRCPETPPGGDA